jgi:hypothetical protein
LIHVATYFGDSARESTTLRTSSMKKGNFGTNGSDLDKNNIIKPTFDTLTEKGRKVLESYRTDLHELFYLRCKVMRQGVILKDSSSIIIRKAKVTLEVRPNPLLSLNYVQSMINSALERQAKSSDELVCRLVEERDGKNLLILMPILLLLLALLIFLKQIYKQVAYRWATLQCQTHLPT